MAIFCENCGAANDEMAILCGSCGAVLNKDLPQDPIPAAPQNPWATAFKQNLKLIVAVVSILALMIGLLNLFGTYDVAASASGYGRSETTYGPLSELREDPPEDIILYIISAFVLGIACLAAAGMSGFSLYLLLNNTAGSKKFFSLSVLVGLAGSVLALLMAMFGGRVSFFGVTITFGINITYWLALLLFGGLLAVEKILLKNDYTPLK